MSVVEFSADSWQASSPGLQKSLADRVEALDALLQGLQSLAASGNISGQGADAMRAYIREVHVPIVQSLLVCLSTFQTAIGVYWSGYSQVDTDGNFRLVNDEFDAHRVQLDTGIEQLRGFAADLRSIAASASHLVSLDGAGAGAADAAAEGFERMRSIVTSQQETWAAYEATDPGFNQVKNLVAELNRVVQNLGSLTVGQGRSYLPGSFNLTLRTLGELTGGMLDYCRENQQAASDGWDTLFSGYVADVEAEQERQRKEDALWGVLWDGIQVVEGVVILAVGVAGTPFSAGATLAFAGLGGSLIVGGVNSAIDHVSIASTGEGLNLVGMASDQVGHWYDVTVMQPAVESGSWAGQFAASVGSGVGQVMSGAAQMNLRDTGRGIEALVFDEGVRHQAWQQVTTLVDQVREGNPVVIGQLVGNALPGAAALKIAKASGLVGRADKFADFGKPIITNPSRTTSALDWLKNQIGAGGVTVSDAMDSVKQGVNGGGDLVPTAHQALMDQLLRVGIKVSPEKVVTIMTTPEGKIVWLERGTTSDVTPNPSGLAHIIEAHGDEFAQKGISESQIPDLLSRAIQENKIVGYQGKGTGRPIYEVEYNGETMKIAITTGSNGYIVGANIK